MQKIWFWGIVTNYFYVGDGQLSDDKCLGLCSFILPNHFLYRWIWKKNNEHNVKVTSSRSQLFTYFLMVQWLPIHSTTRLLMSSTKKWENESRNSSSFILIHWTPNSYIHHTWVVSSVSAHHIFDGRSNPVTSANPS